jgi:hypothetical protein
MKYFLKSFILAPAGTSANKLYRPRLELFAIIYAQLLTKLVSRSMRKEALSLLVLVFAAIAFIGSDITDTIRLDVVVVAFASVAVTVTVTGSVVRAVGVPDTTPVVLSRDRPRGRVPVRA